MSLKILEEILRRRKVFKCLKSASPHTALLHTRRKKKTMEKSDSDSKSPVRREEHEGYPAMIP